MYLLGTLGTHRILWGGVAIIYVSKVVTGKRSRRMGGGANYSAYYLAIQAIGSDS